MKQCCSPVLGESAPGRSGWKTNDPRNLRSSRSPDPRCQRLGRALIITPFGDRWFCYQHFPIWKAHYGIVERILSIPTR